MADSNESDRKTLDEIRSELAAAYPVALEAEQAPIRALDEGATERHRERRRRYIMAAVFVGITAPLLLVAGQALTRGSVQLNPPPIAPVVIAPRVASAGAVREPQPAAVVVTPAALVEMERQLKALSSEVKALTDRLARSDSRIGGIESQVQSVGSSMRRLQDDAAAATAARTTERTVPPPRRTATTPARAVAVASNAPAASERLVPAKFPVPESAPSPKEIRTAEEMLPATHDVAKTAETGAPTTLRQKLSAEWQTIKQSFAGAGGNFKAAMRDLGRTVTNE